jgi:hypothetical protein
VSTKKERGAVTALVVLSPGVKLPAVELITYLQLVPRQKKNVDLYIHSPIRYHGVVLN